LIEIIPFRSTRASKQIVALGSVEEWTIFNMDFIRHPFHIHVNPCWVVRINDKPTDPYWADTLALPSGTPKIQGRSRFVHAFSISKARTSCIATCWPTKTWG
jgi:FtsP/CotA-like multicopper oxidase with cupredoxin domain